MKVGIILDGKDVPLWIYRVIEKVADSDFAEIILVFYNNYEESGNNDLKFSFIYKLHNRLDRFIASKYIDFNKVIDASGIIKGIPNISINSGPNKECNKIDDILHDLSGHELDVIINFGSLDFNGSKLQPAKYGIWQYRIENRNVTGDFLTGYWKLVNKAPVMETVLHCSNSSFDEKEIAIHRSWIPTSFNSIHLNLNRAYGLCSNVIPRLIKSINLNGPAFFQDLKLRYEKTDDEPDQKIYTPPSNIQALINIFIILFRYAINKIAYQYKWRWSLMYTLDQNPFTVNKHIYNELAPPKDRYWADPFVICRNGKFFIYIEEVIYRTNKGHIALLELDKEGKLMRTEKILEKPYHMSYPFVFEYDNNVYMIPETSENRTIELYKCEEFPRKWSFVMNLMENIFAMDNTLFFFRNKWWLFTAINESPDFLDYAELFLFYSGDLFTTEWISHPNNPLVTDIRNARPAGRIFIHENKIYRPSQDCSVRYGRAFNLNHIITLTETTYKEVLISKTEADWEAKLKGTHTFNFDKNFIVIDTYKFNKRFQFLNISKSKSQTIENKT